MPLHGQNGQPAAGDSADTASATAPVVVWLRNELRLCDNPLLQRGLQLAKGNLQLVVCLDPREFQATTAFGSPKAVGELRKRFVAQRIEVEECLCDLRRRVAERGSRLLVQQKAPEEVLPALVSEGSTVLVTAQVCSEERAVERRVRKALEAKGAALEVVPAAGITDLVGPEELQRAGVPSGEEFPVIFQRFFLPLRPFLLEICQKGLSDAPVNLPSASGAELEDEELRLTDAVPGTDIRGGETAGLERMTVWLNSGFRSYKDTFRSLQGDYSSRLGAHLAYGCISPRRLVKEALSHGSGQSSVHVEHFVYEMCWRDFFRHTAARWGTGLFHVAGPAECGAHGMSSESSWKRDLGAERRWKEGSTGVPLVDAAMRELNETGYIGNLARQFAAAFLIEDLQIDWRVGADWFEATLVDYDVHSNWGQWARSAGVVPTNEAKRNRVGGTRYYDLAMQRPEVSDYVRNWLPELQDVADEELFSPWTNSWPIGKVLSATSNGSSYSKPLISMRLKQYFESVSGASRLRGLPSPRRAKKGKGQRKGGGAPRATAALRWATSDSRFHGS
ncbi:Cryptochrome DASH [Durusdinium trenchii]|uniref:Cryptochrome DASH n=2 Tax=Durusdinium trenchii TaxID=1381693 RepID=A0ABP0R524_9DINO